jgi:hypothetical protein
MRNGNGNEIFLAEVKIETERRFSGTDAETEVFVSD